MREGSPRSWEGLLILLALVLLVSVTACQAQDNKVINIPSFIANGSLDEDLFAFLKQDTGSARDLLQQTQAMPRLKPFPTVTAPMRIGVPTQSLPAVKTMVPATPSPATTRTMPPSMTTRGTVPSPTLALSMNTTTAAASGGGQGHTGPGPWTGVAFLSGLLLLAGIVYLVLLRDSIRGRGPLPAAWWEPHSRVLAGSHAVLASVFAGAALGTLSLLLEGRGDPVLVFPATALAGFAAISSLGMAYSSLSGRTPQKVGRVHGLVTLAGTLLIPILALPQGNEGPSLLVIAPSYQLSPSRQSSTVSMVRLCPGRESRSLTQSSSRTTSPPGQDRSFPQPLQAGIPVPASSSRVELPRSFPHTRGPMVCRSPSRSPSGLTSRPEDHSSAR